MGRDYKGAPGGGVVLQQQAVKILPRDDVQPGRWLVHHRDGRAAGQRQHDGHGAHHPLGKRVQPLFLLQAKLLYQFAGIGFVPVRVKQPPGPQVVFYAHTGDAGGQLAAQFPAETQLAQGGLILPHGGAAVANLPGIQRDLRRQPGQQRRLARAVAANQPVDMPRFQRQAHIVQRRLFAVGLAQVRGRQNFGFHRSFLLFAGVAQHGLQFLSRQTQLAGFGGQGAHILLQKFAAPFGADALGRARGHKHA